MIKTHLKNRLKLFSQQPFRWFVISALFATFGNGLIYVTLSWMVISSGNSIAAQALLMICLWSPSIILGPFLGVIADRHNRKYLTIVSNLVRGCLILGYCALVSKSGFQAGLCMLALGLGSFSSIYNPAANVLIREILPQDDLLNANATMDVVYEFGSVFGMAASGLCINFLSYSTTLQIGGLFFALAAFCNWLMIYKPHSYGKIEKKKTSSFEDFISSLKYLKNNSLLLKGYSAQVCISVVLMTLPAMLAPFVKQKLGASVAEFGYLEAIFSCGVVAGGIASPLIAELIGLRKVLIFHLSVLAVSLILFSSVMQIYFSYIIYLLIGINISSWALILTKNQELTDINFQGRLYSIFNSTGGVLVLALFLQMVCFGNVISIEKIYWFEAALSIIALGFLFKMPFKSQIEAPALEAYDAKYR